MKIKLIKVAIVLSIFTSLPSNLLASDLLVAGESSQNVLRYDGRTGNFIEEFIAPGSGGIDDPVGITFGPNGNLFVLDITLGQILEYNGNNGDFIANFAAAGGDDIVVGPDGNFYAGDFNNDQVLKITPQGASSPFATGVDAQEGIAFGPDGNLYVASFGEDNIRRFNGQTGQLIDVFVTAGSGGLDGPSGIAFGPDGNLYVTSFAPDSVFRFDGSNGAFIDIFIPTGTGGLDNPFGIRFRNDGNLYVGSGGSDEILRFNGTTGAFIDAFVTSGSGGLDAPAYFTFFPAGFINFAMANFSVDEDGGNATIEILRTQGSSGPVEVQFTTSNGTALAGTDYEDASQLISFLDGETSKSVNIPIIDDGTVGGSKTVNLALSDPTDDATLGDLATAVLTIVEDDVPSNGGGCQLGSASIPGLSWFGSWIGLMGLALCRLLRKNR